MPCHTVCRASAIRCAQQQGHLLTCASLRLPGATLSGRKRCSPPPRAMGDGISAPQLSRQSCATGVGAAGPGGAPDKRLSRFVRWLGATAGSSDPRTLASKAAASSSCASSSEGGSAAPPVACWLPPAAPPAAAPPAGLAPSAPGCLLWVWSSDGSWSLLVAVECGSSAAAEAC